MVQSPTLTSLICISILYTRRIEISVVPHVNLDSQNHITLDRVLYIDRILAGHSKEKLPPKYPLTFE